MTKSVKGHAARVRALHEDLSYWSGRFRIDVRSLRGTRVRRDGIMYRLFKIELGEAAMTEERVSAIDKLVKALEEAGAPAEMLERARSGYYDEYKSELSAPILKLAQDAQLHGLKEIATRAIRGEFDSSLWEASEWADSDKGKAEIKDAVEKNPELEPVVQAARQVEARRKNKP